MSTITAILEPNPDGTLHLPLPPELRHGKVKVDATVVAFHEEDADATMDASELNKQSSVPSATPEMVRERREAFKALRADGGLREIIPDPVAWQREQRQDRPLPGRE